MTSYQTLAACFGRDGEEAQSQVLCEIVEDARRYRRVQIVLEP